MAMPIETVDCQLFRVPLDEVLVDAKHGDHSHFELVVVRITAVAADGSGPLEGVGYTYTGGKGGLSIQAMLVHDIAPFIVGKDASRIDALNHA